MLSTVRCAGLAGVPAAWQAVGMVEQDPDNGSKSDPKVHGKSKLTAFGEPLWVDALKTAGVGLVILLIVILGGGALAVAIMAPWGRASHDCSIYCVIEREFDALFYGKPAGSPASKSR